MFFFRILQVDVINSFFTFNKLMSLEYDRVVIYTGLFNTISMNVKFGLNFFYELHTTPTAEKADRLDKF